MTEILEILEQINPWWNNKDFETEISRDKYLNKIKSYLKSKEILVLTGVRRAGKTTLLMQTIKSLLEKGVEQKQILFVNFDEADLSNLKTPIKSVLDTYLSEVADDTKKSYLIFDEVQNIEEWERWAKTIYDGKKHQLIISGSSSHLLDSKLASLLSGRYLKIEIFPLDFKEYLTFNDIEINNKISLVSQKNKILKELKNYLLKGGFPRIVLEKNEKLRNELLKIYYETIIYKDIILMNKIRDQKLMRELLYYLMSNFTSLYSYKKISNNLSADFSTIKEYFDYIESSKIFFEIPIFSYSLKTQLRNNKKIYCIDNGLRNAISFKFSRDEGRLAENLVFLELKRKQEQIYYWKDKNEVDFVVKNRDASLRAINVSYTNEISEREINGLLEFKNNFNKSNELIIITKNKEETITIEKNNIKFIPLWKWLLVD